MRGQQPASNWRDPIINALKAIGQLKRKGKFDTGSEFMNKNTQNVYKKLDKEPKKVQPGQDLTNFMADPDNLLGDTNIKASKKTKKSKKNKKITVDEINAAIESNSNNAGTYSIPTEFPLEAKLAQPASPSSDLKDQPGSEEKNEPSADNE